MKITTASALSAGTLGLAGLVTAGLLAMPATATSAGAADDQYLKRDDDTPDIVLVADDDDDDDTNARDNTNTNTQGQTRTRTNDNTGTGAATGRDKSRERLQRDFTQDGPGAQKRDFSARHTNDRSRNNTRR